MKDRINNTSGMTSPVSRFKQRLRFVSYAWLLGCAAVLYSAPRSDVLFHALYRDPPVK